MPIVEVCSAPGEEAEPFESTHDVMGWEISERGFRIVLSADVPTVVREHLGRNVDDRL